MSDMPLAQVARSCSVRPDVAWVEGDNRIVIVNLAAARSAEPMVCPEPAATLWRTLAEGPHTVDDLTTVAVAAVGLQAAPGLVDAFLEVFGASGLIVVSA